MLSVYRRRFAGWYRRFFDGCMDKLLESRGVYNRDADGRFREWARRFMMRKVMELAACDGFCARRNTRKSLVAVVAAAGLAVVVPLVAGTFHVALAMAVAFVSVCMLAGTLYETSFWDGRPDWDVGIEVCDRPSAWYRLSDRGAEAVISSSMVVHMADMSKAYTRNGKDGLFWKFYSNVWDWMSRTFVEGALEDVR